jgi:hypothetical protein
MAITTETLDNMERLLFFEQVAPNALRQLPFELVTIDHEFQAYQPLSLAWMDSRGRQRRGKITGMVVLKKNQALPIPAREDRGQFAVWEFQGRGIGA